MLGHPACQSPFAIREGKEQHELMMGRKCHRFLLAFALVVLGAPALLAKPRKPQPEQLMARARKLTDFRSEGSEPFRLTADFKLFDKVKGQQEGTYTLLWLSPEKWREEISLPGATQVRILVGNRIWLQRSSPALPYLVYNLEHALDFRYWLAATPGERYSTVKSRKLNGAPADCFKARHGAGGRGDAELCFDPASGVLLSIGGKANGTFLSHYEQWGSKLVPHTVTDFRNQVPDVEFTVTHLSSPGHPGAGEFFAPPGAVEMRGCQDPTWPVMVNRGHPDLPYMANLRHLFGTVVVLGEVGVDGKVHQAAVVDSPNEAMNPAALTGVVGMQYRPATCNGVPVPFELVIDFNFEQRR
jgi:TonB family protein